MRVRDLCYINCKNLNDDIEFDSYLYLDTGSITENVIDNIQIYQNKDELPSRAKRMVSPGDIIISTVRPIQKHYGILERPDQNLLVSTGFTVLTPKKGKVNGHYLYYYLTQEKMTQYFQMIAESSVSSYPSITPDIIGNVEVKLPSLEEQNRVVDIIKKLGAKITLNLKLIDLLEEYTQLIFYKWFIDFNFLDEKGREYKHNGGQMYEIGGKLIPVGWELIPLNKIVNKGTETINPLEQPNKVFKHYSIPTFDETKTYANELGSTIHSNKYKVKRNSLLVSKLNPWFKRVVYPFGIDEAICSTEFVVWQPIVENHREYLYILAKTTKFTRHCIKASTGTSNSHKRVNPDYMLKFKVPYKKKVVMKFNEMMKPVIQKIHFMIAENHLLGITRNLLIKKLIK